MTVNSSKGVNFDDNWIEEEIQRELDELEIGNESDEGNETEEPSGKQPVVISDSQDADAGSFSNLLTSYLPKISKQTEDLEHDLQECDELLNMAAIVSSRQASRFDVSLQSELKHLADEVGTDIESLKLKIFLDVDREEDVINDVVNVDNSALHEYNQDLNEVTSLEVEMNQKMIELQQKQQQHEMERKQIEESWRLNEVKHHQELTSQWQQKRTLLAQEESKLIAEKKAREEQLDKEKVEIQSHIDKTLGIFQMEINRLSEEMKREREMFEQIQAENDAKQKLKRLQAAIRIQAVYRRYRTRKIYGAELEKKLTCYRERIRQEKIRMEEERKKKEAEERRMKDLEEQREKELERQRIEEEKQRTRLLEEQKMKLAEEERLLKEKKRLEELAMKKQLEEQKRKEEAERKSLEEQRRKEEKKRKVEEERRKNEKAKQNEDDSKRRNEEAKLSKEQEDKTANEVHVPVSSKKLEAAEESKNAHTKTGQTQSAGKLQNVPRADSKQEAVTGTVSKSGNIEQSTVAATSVVAVVDSGVDATVVGAAVEGKASSDQNINDAMSDDKVANNDQLLSAASRESHQTVCAALPVNVRAADSVVLAATSNKMQDKPTAVKREDASSAKTDHSLYESIEKRRLQWMKEAQLLTTCKTPTAASAQRFQPKALRRPASAKHLAPLEEKVITMLAEVSALQQVTTLELHDLPGCDLITLSRCVNLKSLRVTGCGVIAVDCLNKLPNLRYVDLCNNKIEMMDFTGSQSLIYLDVSHNRLSSIHGLSGCSLLRHINLSHNKITRIGGFESLASLHTVLLSNNLLITTKQLNESPTIQVLDVSHNHLPLLDSVDQLPLLEVLDVRDNNLSAFPSLTNQVLLFELLLDCNNLTSLNGVQNFWLPSLCKLSASQNSLSSIADLGYCINLQSLDLTSNQITDLTAVSVLSSCRGLQVLSLSGNPVTEELQYRNLVTRSLVSLRSLDGAPTGSHERSENSDSWVAFCQSSTYERQQLRSSFVNKSSSMDVDRFKRIDTFCQLCTDYFDDSRNLVLDHRFMHENGTTKRPHRPSAPAPNVTTSATTTLKSALKAECTANVSDARSKFEQALREAAAGGSSNNVNASLSGVDAQAVNKTTTTPVETAVNPLKRHDLTHIPPHHSINKSPFGHQGSQQLSFSRNSVKVAWMTSSDDLKQLSKAATKIQAVWRGHRLRRRLRNALSAVSDNLDADLPDIDLNNITGVEQNDLLADWTVPDTPGRPSKSLRPGYVPVIGMNSYRSVYSQEVDTTRFGHHLQAWSNVEPRMNNVGSSGLQTTSTLFPTGKPPLPPVLLQQQSPSIGHEPATPTSQRAAGFSKKDEELLEEWKFKNERTVELLKQRARKMENNALHKKKLSQLDPQQRLALFRKLEEISGVQPVQMPAKRQPARVDYFQAMAQQQEDERRVNSADRHQRANYTYDYGMKRGTSEGSLPRIDSNLLQGAVRSQHSLMSPASLEIESVDSASLLGSANSSYRRRVSLNNKKLPPLDPAKTNSRPSVATNHEKMSWRSPQVDKSTGWGGGKKRGVIK